ncbi:MAG: hypothetical protein DRN88_04855 [Candidatus Hydrothermarchaeota archaeon]|nr:MAG: hypothetical protein DRN88_04855 [Candidatus Hydrothermarchaeota archaeon]
MKSMIFVDSSVFLKHFLEGDKRVLKFLEENQGNLVTCDIVVNEVVYVLMKQYIMNKYNLKHYDAIEAMKEEEMFREAFEAAKVFFVVLNAIGCDVIPNARYTSMVKCMEKFSLLPNDALIVATCIDHGIRKIATFDIDFKKIDFLEFIEL